MTQKNNSSRAKALNKGKPGRLSFWEWMKMKLFGWCDGRKGLPARDQEGNWTSPLIHRERYRYEEFCSKQWGGLQLAAEETYSRLLSQLDAIDAMEAELCRTEAELKGMIGDESRATLRKHGEDNLTPQQVMNRRAREKAKAMAPLQNRKNSLTSSLSESRRIASELFNALSEHVNSTRMICKRMKDHIRGRITVYWNAARRRHIDRDDIPILPVIALSEEAERLFLANHKDLMAAVMAWMEKENEASNGTDSTNREVA